VDALRATPVTQLEPKFTGHVTGISHKSNISVFGARILRYESGAARNTQYRWASSCVFIADNNPAELIRRRIEQGEQLWGASFELGGRGQTHLRSFVT
jgi:hypothetical protein